MSKRPTMNKKRHKLAAHIQTYPRPANVLNTHDSQIHAHPPFTLYWTTVTKNAIRFGERFRRCRSIRTSHSWYQEFILNGCKKIRTWFIFHSALHMKFCAILRWRERHSMIRRLPSWVDLDRRKMYVDKHPDQRILREEKNQSLSALKHQEYDIRHIFEAKDGLLKQNGLLFHFLDPRAEKELINHHHRSESMHMTEHLPTQEQWIVLCRDPHGTKCNAAKTQFTNLLFIHRSHRSFPYKFRHSTSLDAFLIVSQVQGQFLSLIISEQTISRKL